MKTKKARRKLRYELVPRRKLSHQQISRMYQLMEENYDCIHREVFEKDLCKKQWVGLLKDNNDKIQGFTTFAINPGNTGTNEYNIIFSGDTIISPEHWGTLELIRGGMFTGGQIVGAEPQKKWYWFLISKGHRTYMYLPLFFIRYYPSSENGKTKDLEGILNSSASKMFGRHWSAETGLIVFPQSQGQLKLALAEASWQKKHRPQVAFFLKKNPQFYEGHELACITEASPENMKGIAREYFEEGMQNPLENLWP